MNPIDVGSKPTSNQISEPRQWLAGALLLLAVIAATAWPAISQGTPRFPDDAGDGSLILFLLEHSWRWINAPLSYSLWDAPFYYPIEGTAAYSDLLAGFGPVYWMARLLGATVPIAATIWFVGQLFFNALAGLWLFRAGCGFSPIAASIGAIAILAANPMQNQFFHPQMISLYYVVFAAGCFIRLVRLGDQLTTRQSHLLFVSAGLAFTLQMYSAFYMAWFLVFIAGITLLVSLIHPGTRAPLIQVARDRWRAALTAGILSVIALLPWVLHYLPASRINPIATADMIYGWIPRWYSWMYMGPLNRWYEWSLDFHYFQWLPPNEAHEHRIGIGIVTLLLAFIGFALSWKRPWTRVLLVLAGTVVVLVTIMPGGVGLWAHIFTYIPGASAVRTVTRIAIPIAIVLAFGVVWLADRLTRSRLWILAILLAAPLGLEGSSQYPTFDIEPMLEHAHATASELEARESCRSFLFLAPEDDHRPAYMKQQSALWIALESGLPTVNGYGHILPDGWEFDSEVVNRELPYEEIEQRVLTWEELHPETSPICIVG